MCEKDPLGLGCKSTFLEGGGLIIISDTKESDSPVFFERISKH